MTPAEQPQRADLFRSMHRGPPLLLPNAWDAMSVRVFVAAGFDAIATTSGGGTPRGAAPIRSAYSRTLHKTDPRMRRDGP